MNADNISYDVIIIGGSYAGLSAAMALARSRRHILIIDGGKPCNRQTPHAHNLLTHDGEPPAQIREAALRDVLAYPTVRLIEGLATDARGSAGDFKVSCTDGSIYRSKRIFLATGVRDIPLPIPGFEACWGISVLHCPYCHGYEVRDAPLAVIGNGDAGFEYARLVRHWSPALTVLSNGPATFSEEQRSKFEAHGIRIDERPVSALIHQNGRLTAVAFETGPELPLTAVFARGGIEQHSDLGARLGCAFQTESPFPELLQVDAFGRASVPGIHAGGDCCSPMRSLANAIGMGMMAGAVLNNELIAAEF